MFFFQVGLSWSKVAGEMTGLLGKLSEDLLLYVYIYSTIDVRVGLQLVSHWTIFSNDFLSQDDHACHIDQLSPATRCPLD